MRRDGVQTQTIVKVASVVVAMTAVLFTAVNIVSTLNAGGGVRMTQPIDRRSDWETLTTRGVTIGPRGASVTVVAFSDFECQACGRFHSSIENARRLYGEKLRVVWRHFPRPGSAGGMAGAVAAECAAQAGAFQAFSTQLFRDTLPPTKEHLRTIAASAGVTDTAGFGRCQDDAAVQSLVEEDMEAGHDIGVMGTPTFLINDAVYFGMPSDLHHILRTAIANAN